MNKKSIWTIIITVIVVAVVVSGGVYLWRSLVTEKEEAAEKLTVPTDWKIYRNETYGFEISYPGSLTAGKTTAESSIVGFIGENDQADVVSIEKYNKLEDFSNLIAVMKYYKRDGYYLVILGFGNALANQIVSTFKFTK